MFRSETLTPCDGDFAVHSRPAKGLSAVFASNAVVKPATAALLCVSLGMLVAELGVLSPVYMACHLRRGKGT